MVYYPFITGLLLYFLLVTSQKIGVLDLEWLKGGCVEKVQSINIHFPTDDTGDFFFFLFGYL